MDVASVRKINRNSFSGCGIIVAVGFSVQHPLFEIISA
jgi:hypothetical protein